MSRSSRRDPLGKRVVLRSEQLEDRVVPAGNVTAFSMGGMLFVRGDGEANRIVIGGAGDNTCVITPLDSTTINGVRGPMAFGDIQFAYDIQLNGGNDYCYFWGSQGTAGIFVQMGDGNDNISIDDAGHDGANVLFTGAGNDRISIGMGEMKALAVDTGVGDDRIDIAGTRLYNSAFNGGGGLDRMGLHLIDWKSVPVTAGFELVYSTLLPVANNDRAKVDQGTVTINVAANDTASLGTLDLSSIRIVAQPREGTARVNPDGTVTYTLTGDSTDGRDSFRYTIRNSGGAESNAATVTLILPTVPDIGAPTPSITSSAGAATNTSPIPFQVAFNEDVTGFTASDLSVVNGTASNFTAVNARTYTFSVTPTAPGDVTVSVAAGAAEDAAGNPSTAATATVVFDTVSPSVQITSSAANPTNLDPIPITVVFNENVKDFIASDVVVTNGSVSGFTVVNASTYTFNIAPTADGLITVNIAAGVATDLAGNPNLVAPEFSIVSNRSGPTILLETTASTPTNLSPIPFTATFSASVNDFLATDVTVANGTVSNFAGSGTTYTFDVTPTADGDVTVSIAAGVATDTLGNSNLAATPVTRAFDGTPPAVVLTTTAGDPTSTSPIPVVATFGEAVGDFTLGDISVSNGSVINFAGSATNFTFDVVPSGPNVVVGIQILADAAHDGAGNGNTNSNLLSMTFNGTAITATIDTTAADPTNLSPIPFTLTFTADVTGIAPGDFTIINGTISNLAGSGMNYTFDITPTANGPIVIDLVAGAGSGAGSEPTSAATFTITSDTAQPTVAITTTAPDPTNLAVIPFTATFSEVVNAFVVGDITVTGGTAGNFQTADNRVVTFDVTPAADGDVTVAIAAGVATDGAGNNNTAGAPITVTSDRTLPSVGVNNSATGAITGTSSDASGVTGVQISIFNGTNYWSGTAFDSATEVFHATTSTDNFVTWSLTFAPGGPFTVAARATDAAANVGTTTNNNVTVL